MYWILFLLGGFILIVYYVLKAERKVNLQLISMGYTPIEKIITDKLIGGHPDINEAINKTIILFKGISLDIMKAGPGMLPVKVAEIGKEFIKNITVEDQSTIEKRVTVGRLLTVGLFAFALKKKTKNELAYLTFDWNDGRFNHETVFEFEGVNAMQKANTARNQVLKLLR